MLLNLFIAIYLSLSPEISNICHNSISPEDQLAKYKPLLALLENNFEASIVLDVSSQKMGDYSEKFKIVYYNNGEFSLQGSNYCFLADKSAFCTLDKEAKEAVIEPKRSLLDLIPNQGQTVTDVKYLYKSDGKTLSAMTIKTNDGTVIKLTIPSISFIQTSKKQIIINTDSLENEGYNVVDLR